MLKTTLRMIARGNGLLRCVCLLVVTIFVPGCTGGSEKVNSVVGTVTYQGKPVDGCNLVFDPIASDPNAKVYSARGMCDEQGHFRLTTFSQNDGAVAGRYRVAIFPKKDISARHADSKVTLAFPERYSDTATSDLEFEVRPGPNVIPIELQQ
jgi:hypothetical protein